MIAKRYKLFLVLLYNLLYTLTSWSQITISYNAAIYGQSVDGISLVQIINSSNEDVLANVAITVREVTAGNVLSVVISNARIRRGVNQLDKAAFSNGRFSFGNNYYGVTARQSGKFPEGEYEYCFAIEVVGAKTRWLSLFFENCFMHQLQPMTPLLLINPVDEDENCNTRPDFTWQPPLPLPIDARSRLVLTELKEKQDIAEAINFNIPLINQGNLTAHQLMYPSGLPELKKGKKYVWQIMVYAGKTVLKKSEIWTYTVKCDEPNAAIQTDSYRDLKENEDGGFYIADQVLRFSLNNPYSETDLNYSVVSTTEPGTVIKGLPVLKLAPGLNKYDIDLREIKSFKKGQEYLLKVKMINGRELRLRFMYKTE